MKYRRLAFKIYHPSTGQIGLQVKNGNNRVVSFEWYNTEAEYEQARKAIV